MLQKIFHVFFFHVIRRKVIMLHYQNNYVELKLVARIWKIFCSIAHYF